MKKWTMFGLILVALALWLVVAVQARPGAPAADLGAAFTYQGQLNLDGRPVAGACDFQFSLYDDEQGMAQIGVTQTLTGVAVSDGLFSVQLDFGAEAFQGDARWLGIQVRCPGDVAYNDLGLQALTATPYALYALGAPWAGIHEMPAGFADGNDDGADYQNVVVVAKSGGDFTGIQAAMDSIGDAGPETPYLVWIAPGVYSETVTLKPYVHVQGAGQASTVITSAISGEDFPPVLATLVLTHHVTLRDLTVGNGGALTESIALLAPPGVTQTLVSDVSARAQGYAAENYAVHVIGIGGYIGLTLQNVDALAEHATKYNTALYNYYHSTLTLRGGTFVARGGESAYAISNTADETELVAENVMALAEDADYNYGLTNGEAVVALYGGSFTARRGTVTAGIFNYTHSTLYAESVSVLGEGASQDNHGLENAMAGATLSGGSFNARGGVNARAIYNHRDTADLQATGVTALAQNAASFNYGLYNADEASARLQGGAFTGRGGTSSNGIYNTDANTTLETHDVAALGEDGTISNRGLSNNTGAVALLHAGSFIARTGGSGIQNYAATLEANDVFALGEGDASYNQGLINTSDATAILRGGSFIARDGSYETRGIYTWGDLTTVQAYGVYAMAENGDENYGLVIQSGAADLTHSTLTGSNYSAYRNSTGDSVLTISNSRLEGGDVFGAVTCVAVTWGTTFYENTCP